MTDYKDYYKEYYKKHRQEYLDRNKKWRTENKERFYELVYKSRKKRATRLQNNGELYIWLSEPERKRRYEKRNRRINQNDRNGKVQD